jgi:hypothetical protein
LNQGRNVKFVTESANLIKIKTLDFWSIHKIDRLMLHLIIINNKINYNSCIYTPFIIKKSILKL